jgi:hypothetical protein
MDANIIKWQSFRPFCRRKCSYLNKIQVTHLRVKEFALFFYQYFPLYGITYPPRKLPPQFTLLQPYNPALNYTMLLRLMQIRFHQ